MIQFDQINEIENTTNQNKVKNLINTKNIRFSLLDVYRYQNEGGMIKSTENNIKERINKTDPIGHVTTNL